MRYFLTLGSSGFGGPIALVGYMQRDLVEERRWFTEAEFQQGLAVGQTMPGPLAAQVAMWLGYLQRGAVGAAAVALPFVLAPFLLVTAVAIVYARYYGGGLPRFGGDRRRLPRRPRLGRQRPRLDRLRRPLGTMGLFFAKAGALTFGSGLAIVPFLHQGLVDDHRWLTEQQFVDAVAMGLISPGPVVIMATFAGYLVAGITGAVIATFAVFLPCYLFVVVPGPLIRRHENHPRVQGFVEGATAAAAGAIAGAAIVISQQVIDSPASIIIATTALAVLLQTKVKVREPALVAAAALVGLIAFS